jgi:hypothetical protein
MMVVRYLLLQMWRAPTTRVLTLGLAHLNAKTHVNAHSTVDSTRARGNATNRQRFQLIARFRQMLSHTALAERPHWPTSTVKDRPARHQFLIARRHARRIYLAAIFVHRNAMLGIATLVSLLLLSNVGVGELPPPHCAIKAPKNHLNVPGRAKLFSTADDMSAVRDAAPQRRQPTTDRPRSER